MGLIQAFFDDMDEMCATLETWDARLIPLDVSKSRVKAATVIQAGTMECQYMYCSFSSALSMHGSPPENLITFNVQEPSERHYWWRGHDIDSLTAWVFPIGGELRSISVPGFQVHTLSVTEDQVARVAEQFGMDLKPGFRRQEVFSVPEYAMNRVRERFNSMRNVTTPFRNEHATEILRLLVPLWLTKARIRSRPAPRFRARDLAMKKSLEFIENADLGRLTIDELLTRCQISERTLQYAYRERFALSPAAFIKSLRLARARTTLLMSDPECHNVADIAARFGFWHPSQFAVDYRKKFGERPSQTLARP